MMSDARPKTRIAPKQFLHAVRVPREDDHEVLALVLHDLQQDLDRLLAVVSLVLGTVEIVGLVNEQDAAHGPLQNLLGLGRGATDVLPDEVITRDGDEMAFADESEAVEDVGHAQRDSRLAGARIAREGHVQGGWLTRDAEFPAHALHKEKRGHLANPGPDGTKPNEFVV